LIVFESLQHIAHDHKLAGWVHASEVTEPGPLVEEIRNLRRELEEVKHERDELRANGGGKPAPGKIKNFLFELGLQGRKVIDGADGKQRTSWWESLPAIVNAALYSRQYMLFNELYTQNSMHECATYLVQATELRNEDINTDFKPEVISHAALIALYQELRERLEEWERTHPTTGNAEILPKMELAFAQQMKSTLSDLLAKARAEADKVSYGAYFAAPCAALSQMDPDYHSLIKLAKKQSDTFEAVLKKLA
jgi:hypothetical protein